MERFTVPVEQYEEALGESLSCRSDTVYIDRRGYAPAVARRHGSDYLDDRAILFTVDQLDDCSPATYRFPENVFGLLDGSAMRAAVDTYGPIGLSFDYDLEDDVYITVRRDPEYSSDALAAAKDVQSRIAELDIDGLRGADADALADLAAAADEYTVDGPDLPLNRPATFDVPHDQLLFETGGGQSFVFATDQPYAITVGDDTPPMTAVDGHWEDIELSTVLENVTWIGKMWVDSDAVAERLDELAEDVLNTVDDHLDVRDHAVSYPHAKTLDNLMDVENLLPGEYRAVDAVGDYDLSLETDADQHKLRFFNGNDPFFDELADTLETAQRNDDTVTAWRYRQKANVDDLQDAYAEWTEEIRVYDTAEDYLPEEAFDADTVKQFCDETELSWRKSDGIFISGLINRMEDDKIVLDDMDDIRCLGYQNDGNHIVIESGVRDMLGYQMTDGVIDLHGPIHTAAPIVGPGMTGGEIYLHEESLHVANNDGGSVYIKRPLASKLPGGDRWKEI